jgi:arabinofuranosyltransferase
VPRAGPCHQHPGCLNSGAIALLPVTSSTRTATALLRSLAFLPWVVLAAALVQNSWFLCEDSFICFRYARNLIEGRGLVFNRGERVEGYTQLAWVLELAALWSWLGIRPEHGSLLLSVACTAATLLCTLRLALATPAKSAGWVTAWIATGLLAVSASFAAWTTGGLETRQFTLLVLVGTALFASGATARGSLLLGLATLTRPEGALVALVCIGWRLGTARGQAPRWRILLAAAGPFALLAGAQLVFRILYYGDWLPNTFHARHVRPWWESGLRFLAAGALDTGLYLQVPLAALAAYALRGTARGHLHQMSLLCIGAHAAYCAHIGGDQFEYRFLDFYWPLLAIAAADAVVWLARGRGPWALALGVLVIFYTGALQTSQAWLSRDLDSREATTSLHIELDERTAPWLAWLPFGVDLAHASNRVRQANLRHLVGQRVREHAVFGWLRQQDWGPYERLPRGLLPAGAVAATFAAGVMPFYLPDLTVIDKLGLCDRVIARSPVSTPNHERVLAHDRRPPPGYLEQRGVNIDVRPAAASRAAALAVAPFAVPFGDSWMPFAATDADWVEATFARHGLVRREPLALATSSEGVTVSGDTVIVTWSHPADAGLEYHAASSFSTGPTKLLGRDVPLGADELLQITLGGRLPAKFQGYAGRLDERGKATVRIELPHGDPLRGRVIHTAFVSLRDGAIVSVSPPLRFSAR